MQSSGPCVIFWNRNRHCEAVMLQPVQIECFGLKCLLESKLNSPTALGVQGKTSVYNLLHFTSQFSSMSSKTAGDKGVGTEYGNSGKGAVGGISGRAGIHSDASSGTGKTLMHAFGICRSLVPQRGLP